MFSQQFFSPSVSKWFKFRLHFFAKLVNSTFIVQMKKSHWNKSVAFKDQIDQLSALYFTPTFLNILFF